jgi:heme/copper-type cytochrome/quinol oxidase subunit 2
MIDTAYAQVRGSRNVDNNATSIPTPSKSQGSTGGQENTQDGLFVVFILAAFIWLIFSAILVYHFRRYGARDGKVQFAQALYISGSLLLLIIALFAIL